MEKQHNKNNISPKLSPITYWAYWKGITKVLTMAMPIAFVVLGVLAFSSCAEEKTNNIADIGGGDGTVETPGGTEEPKIAKNFISKWTTAAAAESIKLPLVSKSNGGDYDFTVDWGDGNTETVSSATLKTDGLIDTTAPNITHTYTTAGTFEVKITGTITGWQFGSASSDAAKLVEISSFGPLDLGPTDGNQFYGAANLTITATDAPGLTSTTSLKQAFRNARHFNADISSWDVSAVTDMSYMFSTATDFDNGGQALSWDDKLSNVTTMNAMFQNVTAFKADISGWDVSAVKNMASMFNSATAFNGNLSGWDVSSVTTMVGMFNGATIFNNGAAAGASTTLSWGDKVVNVTTMYAMFQNARHFNADISGWNVGKVTTVQIMFKGAIAFNQDLNPWDARITTIPTCTDIFSGATLMLANTNNIPPKLSSC